MNVSIAYTNPKSDRLNNDFVCSPVPVGNFTCIPRLHERLCIEDMPKELVSKLSANTDRWFLEVINVTYHFWGKDAPFCILEVTPILSMSKADVDVMKPF